MVLNRRSIGNMLPAFSSATSAAQILKWAWSLCESPSAHVALKNVLSKCNVKDSVHQELLVGYCIKPIASLPNREQ